jgi:hypothetical protein
MREFEGLYVGTKDADMAEGYGIGIHTESLFDQNEDNAGELIDWTTGQPFDNSTDFGLGGLTIISVEELEAYDEETLIAEGIDPEEGRVVSLNPTHPGLAGLAIEQFIIEEQAA